MLGNRRLHDAYSSEPAMVRVLLQRTGNLILKTQLPILECCVGNGELVKPLTSVGLRVITNDIRDSCEADYHLDATQLELWCQNDLDIGWVITNPPYKAGSLDLIMSNALAFAVDGVALILRLSANEPVVKRGLRGRVLMAYADCLRYLITFSAPRPSYTGDGKTDSVTTCWFVWDKTWSWKRLGIAPPFQYATHWR